MTLDYKSFIKDCEEIFETDLESYGFKIITVDAEEYICTLENKAWKIEISMLTNFPHIGVAFEFKSNLDHTINHQVVEKALQIDKNLTIEIYNSFFKEYDYTKKTPEERYRDEMKFSVAILKQNYKPLLMGDFTYSDYLTYK